MSSSRWLMVFVVTCVVAAFAYLGLRQVGRSVRGPRPDLKFASFVTADPMFPNPGQSATLHVLIENAGEGAVGKGVEVAAFTSDPRETTGESPVFSGRLAEPLGPGERKTIELPFTAPDEPQEVRFYFVLDPEQTIREATRENNVLLGVVRVVPPRPPAPDLAVEEVRFEPPAPRANEDFAVVAVVKNAGDAASPSPAFLDLYVNDPIGPQPRLPGTKRLRAPPLEPGATASLSARIRFDAPQLVGVYAQIDTDQQVDEGDETNNIEGPVIVAVGSSEQHGTPDLVIESLKLAPPTPTIGERGQLRVRIKNQGGADTTSGFSVDVEFRPEGRPPPGFPPPDETEPQHSLDLRFLAAGQTFELPPIPIPFTRGGPWKIAAVVDPYNQVDEGDKEGNNRTELAAQVVLKR